MPFTWTYTGAFTHRYLRTHTDIEEGILIRGSLRDMFVTTNSYHDILLEQRHVYI